MTKDVERAIVYFLVLIMLPLMVKATYITEKQLSEYHQFNYEYSYITHSEQIYFSRQLMAVKREGNRDKTARQVPNKQLR